MASGFTAEQIVQMMAAMRKERGRQLSRRGRWNRYPYRGDSAVSGRFIDLEIGEHLQTEGGTNIQTEGAA